jgi:hypothetical protein
MARSPQRFIYTVLGTVMIAVALFTFVNPSLCATGCGNLTEPLFLFLYAVLGEWGPRLLFFAAATFFFWAAASVRE